MSVENLKKIWPEWELEEKPLGKGSYGVVYKAIRRDHNVESYAAIKVISIPSDSSEVESIRSEGLDMDATRKYFQGIVDDFVSEIQLMQSLKGVQNIVSVEDYKVVEKSNEVGWDIYIRMELLDSFNTFICGKTLSEEEVIKLGCDICTALEICAKRNIIHRDIKPENIFINDFGYYKLGDFGIARKMENMTGGLSQKGTFNYMAPEVANSSEYDARVDTYSLGLVLYRLLNGNRLPFLDSEKQLLNPNERRVAVERRIRGEKLPAPCAASPEMADLILRACAYDPDMRFSSATEMKQALVNVANGTYYIIESDLDKTTSVRRAPVKHEENNDGNKVKDSSEQSSTPKVNIFGAIPKKDNKMFALIAAVVALVIVVGLGIVVISEIGNNDKKTDSNKNTASDKNSGSNSNEKDNNSKDDKKQISYIIDEAQKLADKENYEGALDKILEGLDTYPKSTELKEKEDEYRGIINEQVKTDTLEKAEKYAESKDYASAIVLIKEAQQNQDYKEYQEALDTYISEYRIEVTASADELASDGDYSGAVSVINEATAKIGDDDELARKARKYEEEYVKGVVAQADAFIQEKNYESASKTINDSLKDFPENQILLEYSTAIKNCRPKTLLMVCPPYQTEGYYADKSYSMTGNVYTNGFHLDDNRGGVAYFNLNKEYRILSFDVGHIDGRNLEKGYYYIYLDGELVHTLTLEPSMLVENVEISVEDASQLVIKGGDWCHCFALVNVTLTPNILVNPSTDNQADNQADNEIDGKILLNVCPPYQSEGYYTDKSYSMAGNSYINGFHLDDNNGGIAYYNLNGKYTTLSFDVGHIDGKNLETGYYYFYLDNELVYTLELNPSMLVEHIEIPLNGATQMVIKGGNWCHCFALANVTLSE